SIRRSGTSGTITTAPLPALPASGLLATGTGHDQARSSSPGSGPAEPPAVSPPNPGMAGGAPAYSGMVVSPSLTSMASPLLFRTLLHEDAWSRRRGGPGRVPALPRRRA